MKGEVVAEVKAAGMGGAGVGAKGAISSIAEVACEGKQVMRCNIEEGRIDLIEFRLLA